MKLEQFKEQTIALLKSKQTPNNMAEFENAIKLIASMEEISEAENFKKIISKLYLEKPYHTDTYCYPEDISVDSIEELLSEVSGTDFYLEDFNGCDQDWSDNIVIDGVHYSVWGSATSGSFCIRLNK